MKWFWFYSVSVILSVTFALLFLEALTKECHLTGSLGENAIGKCIGICEEPDRLTGSTAKTNSPGAYTHCLPQELYDDASTNDYIAQLLCRAEQVFPMLITDGKPDAFTSSHRHKIIAGKLSHGAFRSLCSCSTWISGRSRSRLHSTSGVEATDNQYSMCRICGQ